MKDFCTFWDRMMYDDNPWYGEMTEAAHSSIAEEEELFDILDPPCGECAACTVPEPWEDPPQMFLADEILPEWSGADSIPLLEILRSQGFPVGETSQMVRGASSSFSETVEMMVLSYSVRAWFSGCLPHTRAAMRTELPRVEI